MATLWGCVVYVLALLMAATDHVAHVHSQPSTQVFTDSACPCRTSAGFISIDCGLADGAGYNDVTNLWYILDGQYIDRGSNANVAASYQSSALPRQLATVRSFPEGARSCYALQPVVAGGKYLVRATFLYVNYDGLQSAQAGKPPLRFDLHLGAKPPTSGAA
uniref:Malectin-like domain-containing protein n=1 Tax=Leersia perrieri TaxID=77586 RepID=A0A0D9V538_9ORYZ